MTKFLKKFGLTTQYEEYTNSNVALLHIFFFNVAIFK